MSIIAWGARLFSVCGALVTLWFPAVAADMAYGPFNVDFPAGGGGITRPLKAWDGAVAFTVYGWVQASEIAPGRALVGGVGDGFLALEAGRPAVWTPAGGVTGGEPLRAGQWRFVAAVFDANSVRLFVDGALVEKMPAGSRRAPPAATRA